MTGMLLEGKWTTVEHFHSQDGVFRRKPTTFRNYISTEPQSRFQPGSSRYHLYVSWACPWAHRTLITRRLKGLDDHISVSVVHYFMGDDGWHFEPATGVIEDPIHNAHYLRDVYLAADPKFTGRVTVPILWDKQEQTIVNNESREIVRMLDHEFGAWASPRDLCPEHLKKEIDATIDSNYEPINNGVYRAGFAGSQDAYDTAIGELFDALERNERLLAKQPFLVGNELTEADICLFTTLIRFDLVYHTHFKCNVKRIVDFPHLWEYTQRVFNEPGIAATTNFDHIKRHYYLSHGSINPNRIVARGPTLF